MARILYTVDSGAHWEFLGEPTSIHGRALRCRYNVCIAGQHVVYEGAPVSESAPTPPRRSPEEREEFRELRCEGETETLSDARSITLDSFSLEAERRSERYDLRFQWKALGSERLSRSRGHIAPFWPQEDEEVVFVWVMAGTPEMLVFNLCYARNHQCRIGIARKGEDVHWLDPEIGAGMVFASPISDDRIGLAVRRHRHLIDPKFSRVVEVDSRGRIHSSVDFASASGLAVSSEGVGLFAFEHDRMWSQDPPRRHRLSMMFANGTRRAVEFDVLAATHHPCRSSDVLTSISFITADYQYSTIIDGDSDRYHRLPPDVLTRGARWTQLDELSDGSWCIRRTGNILPSPMSLQLYSTPEGGLEGVIPYRLWSGNQFASASSRCH